MKPAFFSMNTSKSDSTVGGDAFAATHEPLDQSQLTAEIARILARRNTGSTVETVKSAPPLRWLGDDVDEAMIEQSELREAAGKSRAAAGSAVAADGRPVSDDARTIETDAGDATPSSLVWVKTARRQRLRARLAGAAGWALSLALSLGIVLAAALAFLGWPAVSSTKTTQLSPASMMTPGTLPPHSGANR